MVLWNALLGPGLLRLRQPPQLLPFIAEFFDSRCTYSQGASIICKIQPVTVDMTTGAVLGDASKIDWPKIDSLLPTWKRWWARQVA